MSVNHIRGTWRCSDASPPVAPKVIESQRNEGIALSRYSGFLWLCSPCERGCRLYIPCLLFFHDNLVQRRNQDGISQLTCHADASKKRNEKTGNELNFVCLFSGPQKFSEEVRATSDCLFKFRNSIAGRTDDTQFALACHQTWNLWKHAVKGFQVH